MGTVVDDVATAADWIARALTSSGYRADFTGASLWEIDRFFDEHSADGAARPGGLLAEKLGSRIFAVGSYMGEVLRRARGGAWSADDGDRQAEIDVTLTLADGTVCWPVQRAMKRFKNGPEDGIAAWGMAFGVDVGDRPPPARQRGWLDRLLRRS